VHIPFALKVWLMKIILQKIYNSYDLFEKNWIVSKLSEIESELIENGFSMKLNKLEH
jgi:hypothetical protein